MENTEQGPTQYTTLARFTEIRSELEVKKSRFIAVLLRVNDEDAAKAQLAAVRKEFYDGRHHCSALLIGADRSIQRSNDDGEPSGTAGAPMLEVLSKRLGPAGLPDLSDVSAVVVRYFGGTLLGAGGLVRAYSDSLNVALDAAPLITQERQRIAHLSVPHQDAGRIEYELRNAGYVILGTDYAQLATLRLSIPDNPAELTQAHHVVASLTSGTADVTLHGTVWTISGN